MAGAAILQAQQLRSIPAIDPSNPDKQYRTSFIAQILRATKLRNIAFTSISEPLESTNSGPSQEILDVHRESEIACAPSNSASVFAIENAGVGCPQWCLESIWLPSGNSNRICDVQLADRIWSLKRWCDMDGKRKLNGAAWIAFFLLIAFLLYALSIGPVLWLAEIGCENGFLSDSFVQWVAVMYLPLLHLAETNEIPLLPGLLHSYFSLWELEITL
ncbi:MAG: hypothetical protein JWN70_3666 [Planctomycetaceae bacterium]|nr:hypothetical protein [Planctomycetaceae bacterium]